MIGDKDAPSLMVLAFLLFHDGKHMVRSSAVSYKSSPFTPVQAFALILRVCYGEGSSLILPLGALHPQQLCPRHFGSRIVL